MEKRSGSCHVIRPRAFPTPFPTGENGSSPRLTIGGACSLRDLVGRVKEQCRWERYLLSEKPLLDDVLAEASQCLASCERSLAHVLGSGMEDGQTVRQGAGWGLCVLSAERLFICLNSSPWFSLLRKGIYNYIIDHTCYLPSCAAPSEPSILQSCCNSSRTAFKESVLSMA